MFKKNIHYPRQYGKYNKYNAKKTEFMGYKFDSKWEAERYGQLASMQMAGVVEDAKGVQTNDFKIKMKLMKAVNNIEIKISKKK